jgi:Ca-activated chloride channel family protein
MRFAHPDAFWLLGGVVALALLAWRQERQRAQKLARLADASLLADLAPQQSAARRTWKHVLTLVGCTLLVLTLARPQVGTQVELEKSRGVNVVVALDVSRSMLARDVRPDRLRRAQAELSDLLESLRGNRVGLVAFAGTAYAPCPLTTDIGTAKMFLRSLNPDAIPQGGTAIGRAMATARALLGAERKAGAEGASARQAAQVLVLVTDGEDHEGDAETEARALKEEGVQLFAVGVGSTLGEPIPVGDGTGPTQYLKDGKGQTVLTRLNEEALQRLAQEAGGEYVAAQDGALGLDKVKLSIAALQKAELQSRMVVTYAEWFQYALAPALLCLLWAQGLPLRRRPQGTRPLRAARGTP